MLTRLSARGLAMLIAAMVMAILAAASLWLAGSVVVVDETGEVESASVVTGDGRQQQLRQLWSGYFRAIPRLEGTIRIRCRDGSTNEGSYVTAHLHSKVRVVGNRPCAHVEEVI